MRKKAFFGVFVAGLAVGIGVSQTLVAPPVQAAPADVIGSPNVAVDTFKNRDDTFVLWSDGSISRASGGPKVNEATDYAAPPASASVAAPTLTPNRVLGAPKVAVRAIPRGDMTLVLFSDGTLMKPTKVAASSESATPGQLYMGNARKWTNSTLSPGIWDDNDEYTLEAMDVGVNGAKFKVTFKKDIKKATKSTANYNVFVSDARQIYTTVVLNGTSSDGGKSWIYDIGAQYPGYNGNVNFPNTFSFSVLGE